MIRYTFFYCMLVALIVACKGTGKINNNPPAKSADTIPVKPAIVTEKVFDDPDDPAIWIDKKNPANSIIVGTDKHKSNGGLYVFSLAGKIDSQRAVTGLKRMNNVDIAYNLKMLKGATDIAVATERDINSIRVFSLPSMKAIDGGGIEVFKDDNMRHPMGIALYTRPSDNAIFAIVGRKDGPKEGYLEQYLLKDNGKGQVIGELVRKFGNYSGKKEIEAIAVDNELGYVYYSDEQFGIRKYYADPARGNEELALFGQGEYMDDNEGISFYKFPNGTGYILVSDQAAGRFNIYPREGAKGNPHQHRRITSVLLSTLRSDGSDLTSVSLPGFKGGLFVAMSDDQTFQFYRWSDIAKRAGLRVKK